MILLFETQRYENYGSADANYWKPKGGRTIKVMNVPDNLTNEAILGMYSVIDINNDSVRDNISYFTKYHEGVPVYEWEQVIEYEDLIEMMLPKSA